MLSVPKCILTLIALMAVTGKSVPKKEEAESRIIGGREATPGQYKFMVNIIIDNRLMCGGSMVAPGLVLTAAHCISSGSPQAYRIRGNIHDLSSGQSTELQAINVIPHPQYDPNSIMNDIAVIQVQPNPAMSSYLRLDTGNSANEGTSARVIGWGLTSPGGNTSRVLKELDLSIVNPGICQRSFGQFNGQSHFCASGTQQGSDSCQGDSGGPVISSDLQTVIGVVSYGSQNCDQYGAAYTRASTYANWVAQYANGQGGQQQQPEQPEQQWEQPEQQWEQPEQQWEQPEEQWGEQEITWI